MEFDTGSLSQREAYKLLTGSVVPRPIAWVSSMDEQGVLNLAPFSFFTAVCSAPPTIAFSCSIRDGENPEKDTYRNIISRGEFVINFVTEALADAMNLTAASLPSDVDEFVHADLTPVPSKAVSVPRVLESPIHFECKLHDVITIGEGRGGGHLVLGNIVHMHIDDALYRDGHNVDVNVYQPVGRLSGSEYTKISHIFSLTRP